VDQRFATSEVLTAVNTNKKLTTCGDFVPDGSGSSIVMVNGSLMAKAEAELFQQAVNHFCLQARLSERIAGFPVSSPSLMPNHSPNIVLLRDSVAQGT
jgi:hypothetical protein